MWSLLFRHKFTARYARDRRVRRGEIRKGKAKDNPFLCVLSELCGENLILTIDHHVYLIMDPLVIPTLRTGFRRAASYQADAVALSASPKLRANINSMPRILGEFS
jgi:hypothetical protein